MSSVEGTSTNMAPEHPMADRLGYVLKRAQHALGRAWMTSSAI